MTTKRVILVIGASSGIGEAIASRLTARNFRVYGTSRDASRVAIPGVEALSVDVFDRATLQATIDRIIENGPYKVSKKAHNFLEAGYFLKHA